MRNIVVVGLQWGDEGKGKIVDWLAEKADVVVRFQGGQNAGHTIKTSNQTFKLSQLPSGILRPGKIGVIGSGVVLDPFSLIREIENIEEKGISITPKNLVIAENTSLLLPIHIEMDRIREERLGKGKIGTTGKGIGPAYEDRVGRRAVKVGDLKDANDLSKALDKLVNHHNILRKGLGVSKTRTEELFQQLNKIAPLISGYAKSTWWISQNLTKTGKMVLFEGAQGTFLDIDHGTYPFVTSSSTVAGNAATGSAVGPRDLGFVLGICKAYQTRVGEGPFPTELFDDDGTTLAAKGHEFGTVTGRPRRCGWIDIPMVKMACTLSGVDGIALMKMDVLDEFDEVKIGIGYRLGEKQMDHLPYQISQQEILEPIYETHPGWRQSTSGIRNKEDLPTNAVNYIKRLEYLIGCPIMLVSNSPLREDTIIYSQQMNNYFDNLPK